MDITGELAIHPIGSKQNVHLEGTEVEINQSGALRSGLSKESSKNRISTSIVLQSLRSLATRIENCKKRRQVVVATGSLTSFYSTCDNNSE